MRRRTDGRRREGREEGKEVEDGRAVRQGNRPMRSKERGMDRKGRGRERRGKGSSKMPPSKQEKERGEGIQTRVGPSGKEEPQGGRGCEGI